MYVVALQPFFTLQSHWHSTALVFQRLKVTRLKKKIYICCLLVLLFVFSSWSANMNKCKMWVKSSRKTKKSRVWASPVSLLHIHALFHKSPVYFSANEAENGFNGLRCDCFSFLSRRGVSFLAQKRPFLSRRIKTQSRTDSPAYPHSCQARVAFSTQSHLSIASV